MLRGGPYESEKTFGMYESKKVKRYRSAFTTSQINYLEKQFAKCPYIGSAMRKDVANLINIPERAIKIWFQNRRMKEKKEVNNAEYNIEGHNNITNDIKFAKNSLINVHSSQSTNDQCSLQVTTKHGDPINFSPYYNSSTFPNQSSIDLKKKTNVKFKGCGMVNNIKREEERPNVSQPTNLTKYNFNNKYNNKNFMNYLELNKKSVTKSKVTPKTAIKAENFRDAINVTSSLPQYQELPEDLSARNLSKVTIPQTHNGNVQFGPAYIPFCNNQEVCISAGNVIWKPINVVPTISPTVPVTIPENQPVNKSNEKECKCNCSCQSRNRPNYDQANIIQQPPQYVIAIPYNNNINILR